MSGGASLIELVGGLLERTYRMETGLDGVGRFIIGDEGYARMYADVPTVRTVGAATSGARLLLRETAEGVRAAVYLPDRLVRTLERYPPQHGVGEENVQEFAALVEETDHLLVVAERARQGRPVSLFEMELHANVSKYLVLSRFLAGRQPVLQADRRWWLWHHLFEGVEYRERHPEVQARYEDAGQWAARMIRALIGRPPEQRLALLRQFHSASTAEKVDLIRNYRG